MKNEITYNWVTCVDICVLLREEKFENVSVAPCGRHENCIEALAVSLIDLCAFAHKKRHAFKVSVPCSEGKGRDSLCIDVACLLECELETVNVAHRSILHEEGLLLLSSLILFLVLFDPHFQLVGTLLVGRITATRHVRGFVIGAHPLDFILQLIL